MAKKLGAKHLINYKRTPNWEDEVLKITGGRGADHVLEVGGPGTIIKSLKAARYGGNVAVIGFVARVRGILLFDHFWTPASDLCFVQLT